MKKTSEDKSANRFALCGLVKNKRIENAYIIRRKEEIMFILLQLATVSLARNRFCFQMATAHGPLQLFEG